ncbi:MAG: hypothetical protein H6835_03480 [Planctomycetes bacterium]|nr:hypothetical protein [Planctomycetota bacterium]
MHTQTNERQGQRGHSLIELVISSTLLVGMIYVLTTLSVQGGEAQEYARRLNRVTEITQDLTDAIRLELVSSVRLFGNDAEGLANLAALDLTGAPTPLGDLQLPTISGTPQLRQDVVGDAITGNSLFFAKVAWDERFACTSGEEYVIDVYRWVYYYLTPEDGGPDPSHPIGINIVRVESEPMADAGCVDRISDPVDQQEVMIHLANSTADADGETHARCAVVWSRGGLPSVVGTFRQIDEDDGSLSTTPFGGRPDPWQVLRSQDAVTGLLSYRHHSIASNYAPGAFGLAKYGVMTNSPNGGFPHGLEIQVVGDSSARQVMVHLVVTSTRRTGHFAWSDLQVMVDTRDL